MSTIIFLVAIACSYLIGYTKRRGEYLELREDFITLVHEDSLVIGEYRTTIDALHTHIRKLEEELKK